MARWLAVAAALLFARAEDEPADREAYRSLVERVAMLEERLRLTNIPEITDDEANERSLLEQFTDTAGDFVMNRLLPRSDPQCRWNYAKSVCVPKCDCAFQHRPGDLTLSRACRVRPLESREEACDNDVSGERGTFEKLATFVSVKAERASREGLAFLRDAAPPSDSECDWDWGLRSCAPAHRCRFRFRFGDFHLGRACRLREAPLEAAPVVAAPEPEVDAFEAFGSGFGIGDDDRDAVLADGGADDPPAEAEEPPPPPPEEEDVPEAPAEEPGEEGEAPEPRAEEPESFASFGLGDDDRDAAW
mmetsp:Transcript_5613/g.16574  ORF Transcript_5613/g.16574 Transcript_5613/m.16574 type:complete len:304 (-) Transcript_5613:21-932(-)